jgi:molybdopterin-containing oxidoreductase family iron-sulfur binding subunit
MKVDRRRFLKLAGLTGIGLGLTGGNILLRGSVWASKPSLHSVSTSTQLAMVIDVRKFQSEEDYQRIIDACHSIHNIPTLIPEKDDPKHEVKWIWTDTFEHAFPYQKNDYLPVSLTEKLFPLLCNHCENPPCVRVCPTKATFKRKKDGIVLMDYHRCIGCRFCMAACPYGARSFNWIDPRPYIEERNPEYPTRTKGVVEKCTFCVERLAQGLIPACVEASNGGIVFGDLRDPHSEVREILSSHYTIRRKPELGTQPSVYYIIGGL